MHFNVKNASGSVWQLIFEKEGSLLREMTQKLQDVSSKKDV